MKTPMIAVAALLALTAASCSTSSYDEPAPPRRGMMSDDGDSGMRMRMARGSFELLPPDNWWQERELADALKLTGEQVKKLDELQTSEGAEVAKLENDQSVAIRDLRRLLESDPPAADAIADASQRLRTMRDDLFARQLRMLSAERAILTRDQWQTLEDELQAMRRPRRNDGGYGGRGGRGGYGGRGGRGGWGGPRTPGVPF